MDTQQNKHGASKRSTFNLRTAPAVKHTFTPTGVALAVALACALSSATAQAAAFALENGLKGSFDSTFSYGLSRRIQSQDAALIGIANGGTAHSVNEDDGDRAYNKGKLFTNAVKGTHELEMKYENFGALIRGTYFYDFENKGRSNLGEEGKKRLGSDVRFLDAFITGSFSVADKNLRMRVGNQVISWGESTFIVNGINVINAVDISKLRIPGAELKEAFIPTSSIWASQELTKNASVEGFVLFNHDKIKLDPRGSYFSNNDFASDDSWRVFVGFGRRGDLTGVAPKNPIPPTTPGLGAPAQAAFGLFSPAAQVWAPRSSDLKAKDSGQYGVAFRYLASELNNTEFGFYHLNYHSRIPLFSGVKGTVTSAITGSQIGTLAGQTGTATYFAEYPENIKLYGLSFNTSGPGGVALQGEVSYRPNQPLQYSTPELLLAALGAPNLSTGFELIPGTISATAPFGASAAALVPNGTYQRGWDRVKMTQMQMTGTKSFPNIFGAEQGVVAGEFGYTKYNGLRTDIKFNGPGVFLPATVQGAVATQSGAVQGTGFVTESSYGYRMVGRLEYANAIFGANVAPRVAFNHDIKGVSPTFNEDTKSLSLGANFDYQKKFTVDVSYTGYFGGRNYCGTAQVTNPAQTTLGAQIGGIPGLFTAQSANYCSSANPLKDRDFVSLVMTYSF